MPAVSYCGMVHENPEAFTERMARVAAGLTTHGIGAALITPGPDLAYLTGYEAVPLERLTCLILRPDQDPVLVVPLLEEAAARVSTYGSGGAEIRTWGELEDPFAMVAHVVGDARVVAVDDHMWASKVLDLRAAMPHAQQVLAGGVLAPLRMRKSAFEVEALREAGAAIDRVHAQVPSLLRPGRTEREVGRDIAEAIIAEGHVRVDFTIVASGPNGASPHHEVSDRVLCSGDAVVVDIGGTMPSGYRSDCTRTYALGEPDELFVEHYAVLEQAQQDGVSAVRPGVSCESIDRAPRGVLENAGLGVYFIHRTGHGIGLETHEDPYMVEGNATLLEPGMAFSVEPGFYIPGQFGARIEDIVVCGEDGPIVLNNQPRSLIRVDA
jgi:Xaa-Pro aminopeptidase